VVLRLFSLIDVDPRDASRVGAFVVRVGSIGIYAVMVGIPAVALGMAVAYLAP
jgi:hypothetical protein